MVVNVNISLKPEEIELIDKARELERRTRSSFLGYSAIEKAKELLQENEN